jgi:hypothetical protein
LIMDAGFLASHQVSNAGGTFRCSVKSFVQETA